MKPVFQNSGSTTEINSSLHFQTKKQTPSSTAVHIDLLRALFRILDPPLKRFPVTKLL